MRKRPMPRNRESGVALLSAILVLMLMSALLVGFISMVNSDQSANGINRDQTQAYAAAHAGVEKLTADLGELFQTNFAPNATEIGNLTVVAKQPTLGGISYLRPNGTTGYRISFNDVVAPIGEPDLETPGGSTIQSGPYQGLVGLITPYTIEVTARTTGSAEVRMRRVMQTVAIPVFQFGIFSENDQSFFAGPNFSFGGRIHTNQHLFLKQDDGNTLALQDRVTAVGEVIRAVLANGVASHNGTVRMAKAAGCPNAGSATNLALCRDLAATEGSVTGGPGSGAWGGWSTLSATGYNGWIKNGLTGARRLDLPLVSNGARPVDIIRRAPATELATSDVHKQRFYSMGTLRVLISDQRADLTALPNIRVTAGVSPMPLSGDFVVDATEGGEPTNLSANTYKFAASNASATYTQLMQAGFRTTAGTSSIGGFIVINLQDRDGNWVDVTKEIMNLGFAGKRISRTGGAPVATPGLAWTPDYVNGCTETHPNAVIRLQRLRDTATTGECTNAVRTTVPLAQDSFVPNVLYDPREGMLRDDVAAAPVAAAVSGAFPSSVVNNDQRLYFGGVMHYVELDVNNLRRWLSGTIGTATRRAANTACVNGAGGGTCPMDETGFVVYFSDRRGNRDDTGGFSAPVTTALAAAPFGVETVYGTNAETGELGFEDLINTTSTSAPNGALDHSFTDAGGNTHFSEDLNWEQPTVPNANAPGRGTLQVYGGRARLLEIAATQGSAAPINRMINPVNTGAAPRDINLYTPVGDPAAVATYQLYANPIDKNVARVNRAFFFRRALKLVHGGYMQLPHNGSQGLTVASENPVYIQGNYNACSATLPAGPAFTPACTGAFFGATPGTDHVSAAVIADAVTFLSNAWNDIRSFTNPHDVDVSGGSKYTGLANAPDTDVARDASTTYYRTAIVSGKGYNFPRSATSATGADHTDWGTDGGAHNFLRFIENWGGAQLNYRGSIVSLYMNRQAVGIYKCCDVVYGAPARGYEFDTEFLTPSLLPPRTPMFRDINTLSFRQVLRPTQ
ncbi:MAG: hypothetical protein ABIT71_01845 [Vicinamibacteraceae bacterium]